MRNWTHRIVIAVPLALLPIAGAVGRAADYDTGGDQSFGATRACKSSATPTHAVSDTLLAADAADGFAAMATSPELLAGYCAADYAARWPGLTPPSLADCTSFLAEAFVRIEPRGRVLEAILAEAGMVLYTPPSTT